MIRKLFKDPKQDLNYTEECDYEDTAMWDSQDTLKRRLNTFKKLSEKKFKDVRSSSIHSYSGCARWYFPK